MHMDGLLDAYSTVLQFILDDGTRVPPAIEKAPMKPQICSSADSPPGVVISSCLLRSRKPMARAAATPRCSRGGAHNLGMAMISGFQQ